MSIECRSIKIVTSKDIKFEKNIVESRVVTNMDEIKLSTKYKGILEKDEKRKSNNRKINALYNNVKKCKR